MGATVVLGLASSSFQASWVQFACLKDEAHRRHSDWTRDVQILVRVVESFVLAHIVDTTLAKN
jgi:hypothetical protein